METTKKRTREEVRAAFKEAMRKKQEWIEESIDKTYSVTHLLN